MHAITRVRARVFGGINFGDLVKNSPICQIKIPAKVSGYTVGAKTINMCTLNRGVRRPRNVASTFISELKNNMSVALVRWTA